MMGERELEGETGTKQERQAEDRDMPEQWIGHRTSGALGGHAWADHIGGGRAPCASLQGLLVGAGSVGRPKWPRRCGRSSRRMHRRTPRCHIMASAPTSPFLGLPALGPLNGHTHDSMSARAQCVSPSAVFEPRRAGRRARICVPTCSRAFCAEAPRLLQTPVGACGGTRCRRRSSKEGRERPRSKHT